MGEAKNNSKSAIHAYQPQPQQTMVPERLPLFRRFFSPPTVHNFTPGIYPSHETRVGDYLDPNNNDGVVESIVEYSHVDGNNPTGSIPPTRKKRIRIRHRKRTRKRSGDGETPCSNDNKSKQKHHDPPMTKRDIYFSLRCGFIQVAVTESTTTSTSTSDGNKNRSHIQDVVARVSLVDWNNITVFDVFVTPRPLPHSTLGNKRHLPGDDTLFSITEVLDYRTTLTGVTAERLQYHEHHSNTVPISQIRQNLMRQIKGRILIGYLLQQQMDALGLSHPWCDTRDVAHFRWFQSCSPTVPGPSAISLPGGGGDNVNQQTRIVPLPNLFEAFLGWKTVTGGLVGEAIGCLALYKYARNDWESDLALIAQKSVAEAASFPHESVRSLHQTTSTSSIGIRSPQTFVASNHVNGSAHENNSQFPLNPSVHAASQPRYRYSERYHFSETSSSSSQVTSRTSNSSSYESWQTQSSHHPAASKGIGESGVQIGSQLNPIHTQEYCLADMDRIARHHRQKRLPKSKKSLDGDGWSSSGSEVEEKLEETDDQSIASDFDGRSLAEDYGLTGSIGRHLPSHLLEDLDYDDDFDDNHGVDCFILPRANDAFSRRGGHQCVAIPLQPSSNKCDTDVNLHSFGEERDWLDVADSEEAHLRSLSAPVIKSFVQLSMEDKEDNI